MTAVALVLVGYLSGSVPFGLLLTWWLAGADVRRAGSGNIGATNVARVAGRGVGALVLVLDAAKGALPVWAGTVLIPDAPMLHAAVGLAAFAGHVFPVWLRFRGGKGVATALGVLVVLVPLAALLGALSWVTMVAIWRLSSLGSLVGGGAAVATSFLGHAPRQYALLASAFFLAILFTHRGNLQRLLQRAEKRL